MPSLLITPFIDHPVAQTMSVVLNIPIAKVNLHTFPDKEISITFETDLQNRDVIILASLNDPNTKILPLLFIAETAKDLGANSIGLCAPYLSYMRQDKQFHPYESITSNYFSKLISSYFDWIITIDPHLHRHHALSEIYSIPNAILHATDLIAEWIVKQVKNPVLIGPDSESKQWVESVANKAGAPYLVLRKTRLADDKVSISFPGLDACQHHTPVLIDDIISTGQTLIETIRHLKTCNMPAPICVAVHAIFAGNAYDDLIAAGAAQIITCNTIPHRTNGIDIAPLIVDSIQWRQKR